MALATSSGVPRRRIGIVSTIFSVPGDRIEVRIDGIGSLTNPMVRIEERANAESV